MAADASVIVFFDQIKPRIALALRELLDRRAAELAAVNPWGRDVCDRLAEFAGRGKMLRGGLVFLASLLYREKPQGAVVETAAALELLQSALLVHDDIMDRDAVRRGIPTLHRQYTLLAEEKGLAESRLFGEAMGICAGDVALFFAFELLAGLDTDAGTRRRVERLCSRELAGVGLAQMQDMYFGALAGRVSEEEVLELYLHKTARYTFCLPLLCGALLEGASESDVSRLEAIGEKLGLIFQLKDDEMGIYGTAEEIGKPVGSDILADKKTLFSLYLFESAQPAERERLQGLFGAAALEADDLAYVRRLGRERGALARTNGRAASLADDARALLDGLSGVREEGRTTLARLLDYSLTRKR